MNRTNLLTAIDLLQFAIKINQTMISNGEALTSKGFAEQEVLDLQSEIHGAQEGIEVLEQVIRDDIEKERSQVALQNKLAANSETINFIVTKIF